MKPRCILFENPAIAAPFMLMFSPVSFPTADIAFGGSPTGVLASKFFHVKLWQGLLLSG